jgi:hypothetical protein
MEKVRIPLIVITVVCLWSLPSSAAVTTHPACEVKFHNLSRYKHERWGRVFRDREVAPVLKSLLGKDYHKLIEQWRSGIEKARSGFEKKPELPVVFKSK